MNTKSTNTETIKMVRLGNVYNDEKFTGCNFGGNVWGGWGLSPTLKTGASASQQFVVVKNDKINKDE